MIRVEVQRRLPASPERVWDVYTDWVGWTDWARLGRVRLARAGEDERNGVGAVRAINNFGFEVAEEIVDFQPVESLRYRVIGGRIPMRDHEGEVVLEPESGGTRMTWRCRFQPTLPLVGPAMRAVVAATFAHVMRRLDQRLAR
jgi:uncharacterized protein YndB with AHSA1/START domain